MLTSLPVLNAWYPGELCVCDIIAQGTIHIKEWTCWPALIFHALYKDRLSPHRNGPCPSCHCLLLFSLLFLLSKDYLNGFISRSSYEKTGLSQSAFIYMYMATTSPSPLLTFFLSSSSFNTSTQRRDTLKTTHIHTTQPDSRYTTEKCFSKAQVILLLLLLLLHTLTQTPLIRISSLRDRLCNLQPEQSVPSPAPVLPAWLITLQNILCWLYQTGLKSTGMPR